MDDKVCDLTETAVRDVENERRKETDARAGAMSTGFLDVRTFCCVYR